MKPGRPPLEPRIAALEKQMDDIRAKLAALRPSEVRASLEPEEYEPLFKRWADVNGH